MELVRTRWAAVGAAVAVTLGGGGVAMVASTSDADALTFVPITACRVVDTRPAEQVGPRSAPLAANDTHTVQATGDVDEAGDCAGVVPADATAISMNVTALNATLLTFLTIWDGSVPRPTSSNLNPAPGQPPTPNAVTTNLNGDGEFSIFNLTGSVDVVADINGYYLPPMITGEDVVDGSLRLGDLGGSRGVMTQTVGSPIQLAPGACRSQLTGNFGASAIGNMVVGTLADPDGDPVLPNTAAVFPSIVIGTTQGGAVPNLVVCNTGTSQLTIPAGSVFTWRMIDP